MARHITAIFAGILGMMLTVASCQRMPAFIHYQDVDHCQWDCRDTVRITIPAQAADIAEPLDIRLRTTNAFPYNSLTLLLTQRDSCGAVLMRDTLRFILTDSLGRPARQGFPYVETSLQTTRPVRLNRGRASIVELTHAMRSMVIDGVYAVGIELR